MKNLFKFIGALAVMISVVKASAQNYTANPVMVTNAIGPSLTNGYNPGLLNYTPISGPVLVQSPKATCWVTFSLYTNTASSSYGNGAGAAQFWIGGSPNANAGPYTAVIPPVITPYTTTQTNNPLLITVNYTNSAVTGSNTLAGYVDFDASGFQSLCILQIGNIGTNTFITNIVPSFTFRQ